MGGPSAGGTARWMSARGQLLRAGADPRANQVPRAGADPRAVQLPASAAPRAVLARVQVHVPTWM
ncbi:hypothetical protein PAHAL_8G154200 [Panicum hallii]|uniref:Uncharacterized protein n=1 Tax=Panicum hallii TaxID=206008 RepID=A0A2T8I907_9POAL|nr:hypothetical protein PAHAL_8G154200 [Panicum hallii]